MHAEMCTRAAGDHRGLAGSDDGNQWFAGPESTRFDAENVAEQDV
jgi:hypothetical protein